MIFLGTPQLCGGVDILFFFKVSFEKHPNVQCTSNVHLNLGEKKTCNQEIQMDVPGHVCNYFTDHFFYVLPLMSGGDDEESCYKEILQEQL